MFFCKIDGYDIPYNIFNKTRTSVPSSKMLFYATWMPSIVNNRVGFCLSVENFLVFTKIPSETVKQFAFYYTIADNGEIVFNRGSAYFRGRNTIDGLVPINFNTPTELYNLILLCAQPGAYGNEIIVRQRIQPTFENCEEIGINPQTVLELIANITTDINNVVFGV